MNGTAVVYRISVRGHLNPDWSAWFDGLSIVPQPDGSTLMVGTVADQAALHGLLAKVRDLGLPLISVEQGDASPR